MKELDKSLPILDVVYRLALELNKAVIKFPRNQRPGLGRKIEDAGFNLEENLICLSDALRQGRYSPAAMPVKYHIASSGERIPVPCLKDRLVALAARKTLLNKLLPSFIYDTYAGIPKRGMHKAVKRVMEFQARVASSQNPRSGWILKLPVLSNLYLDSFDHFIKDELGFKFYVRYADDMVFVSKDKNELEFIMDKARQFLEEKLGVFLNPGKILLKPTANGLDFLGYRIFYYHLLLRKKNMKKAKKQFFNLARRYAKGDLKLLDIKSSLAGWLGYAGFANTYNFRRNLFADFTLRKHSLN